MIHSFVGNEIITKPHTFANWLMWSFWELHKLTSSSALFISSQHSIRRISLGRWVHINLSLTHQVCNFLALDITLIYYAVAPKSSWDWLILMIVFSVITLWAQIGLVKTSRSFLLQWKPMSKNKTQSIHIPEDSKLWTGLKWLSPLSHLRNVKKSGGWSCRRLVTV